VSQEIVVRGRSVDRCSVKRSIQADPDIRVHLEWTEEAGYHA
jgi:hypothetical protein